MRLSAIGNFLHGTIWLPASIWCIDKGRFPVERGIKWKYEKILDIGTFRNLWMIIYVSTLKNYASFRKKLRLHLQNFILEKLSVRCVNENFRYFPFSHLTGPPPLANRDLNFNAQGRGWYRWIGNWKSSTKMVIKIFWVT